MSALRAYGRRCRVPPWAAVLLAFGELSLFLSQTLRFTQYHVESAVWRD